MTAIINVPGATLPASAIDFATIENNGFPATNMLFHVDADHVTETDISGDSVETRVSAFTDLETAASYAAEAHKTGKVVTENGLAVIENSLQAGVATSERNYPMPATFLHARERVVLCGISKPDPAMSAFQCVFGAAALANNTTFNGSRLLNVEYVTPTQLRVRAEAPSLALTLAESIASVSGLPADGYAFWRVMLDYANHILRLEVDGIGSDEVAAFADGPSPSINTLTIRNGWFQAVTPTPSNAGLGNPFRGRFRRGAGFTDEFTTTQETQLVSVFRAETTVLNR